MGPKKKVYGCMGKAQKKRMLGTMTNGIGGASGVFDFSVSLAFHSRTVLYGWDGVSGGVVLYLQDRTLCSNGSFLVCLVHSLGLLANLVILINPPYPVRKPASQME